MALNFDIRTVTAIMSEIKEFNSVALEEEKPLLKEWKHYPLDLLHTSTSFDLKAYDERLTEMSSTIFCEEEDDTEINIIDVLGMLC